MTVTYHPDTSPEVRAALDRAIQSQERVRLWLGDTKTGEAWAEENDVTGRVSTSMGPMRIPILVNNRRSMAGGAILDRCVVAIKSTATGRWLYRHPTFDPGSWTLRESAEPGYAVEALNAEGEVNARFKNRKAAENWLAFMKGERFAK